MNVAVCYVYPSLNRAVYDAMARRFVSTYQEHPPGDHPHDLYVLLNGLKHAGVEKLFEPLPVRFLRHSNIGRDIGAYQMAASRLDCDLMVCLGSPVHFHKDGWLDWLIASYQDCGPAVYGPWAFHEPLPHIRTTAFWLPRFLLNAFPHLVGDPQRYEFEHGKESLTLWAKSLGYSTFMVTWDGTFGMKDWHHVTRDKSLLLDQHSERDHLK
jgi:hypothetical protein